MVGTRAHPNCKLTKEHLLSRAVGNKRKHKIAKQDASLLPTSLTLPSSSSPILVAGRPLPTTPPVTPVIDISGRPKGKPITRRDIPTCLDFGKFRRILYPSFMFCSPCDWWEQELYHRSQKTIKTTNRSQKYLCKCQHTSFASPSSSSKKKYLRETTRPPLQVNPPLPTKYKEYNPTVLLQGSSGGKEESIIEDASVNNKVSGFTESTDHRKPSSAMQPDDQLHSHPANAFPDACPTSPMIILAGAATILPCLLNSASPKAPLAIHVEQELATELLYDETGSDGCEDEHKDHEPQSNQFEEAMVIEQPSFSAPILPREQEVVVEEISNENSMNDPSSLHLTPASDGVSFYEGECVRLMSALMIKDQRLAAANKKIARLEKKLLSNEKKGEEFKLKCSAKYVTRQVKLYIKRQSKRRDCKQNTVVANFFRSLMSVEDEEVEGEFSTELMQCIEDNLCTSARQSIRTRYLTKHACLRLMDLEGHKLSLQSFNLICRLETGGRKYARNCCLPSSGDIQQAQRKVDQFALSQVDMKHGYLSNNKREEHIEFKSDKLLTLMVNAYGLADVAKHRAVRINLSIDGAELSKKITHVTCGFKISDVAAKCPLTNRPLFLNSKNATMQSRNLCIPVKIIMKKETSDIYDEFRDVFSKFRAMSDLWNEEADGPRPSSKWINEGNFPIKLALNMDLSATWKFFGMGGAAKNID